MTTANLISISAASEPWRPGDPRRRQTLNRVWRSYAVLGICLAAVIGAQTPAAAQPPARTSAPAPTRPTWTPNRANGINQTRFSPTSTQAAPGTRQKGHPPIVAHEAADTQTPSPVRVAAAQPSGLDQPQLIPVTTKDGRITVRSKAENVSLVARDAPLRELLALLAKSQQLNLVFAGGGSAGGAAGSNGATQGGGASNLVANSLGQSPAGQAVPSSGGNGPSVGAGGGIGGARVTVSLEDVPLETALDTILAVSGYTWTRSQGVILVTPSSQGTRLPPHAQGRTLQVFPLDFAAAEDVDLAVKGLLSPIGQSFAQLSSSSDNRRGTDTIVVEDKPRYLERIANYIAQVDVPPRQVAIQAYILQVNLDDKLRHGVNLEYLAGLTNPELTIGTRGFARTQPAQAVFLELDGQRLDGLLEAIRTTTDAKTLAAPRLLAVNGQQARLQVGEQLGFRVTTTTQTSSLESVEFLNVGVVLSVTPRISRDGRVLLRVSPEVSSGQVNPETGLPEEETAELQTDVLLEDGQGLVVGGLIKEELSNGQAKVPVLGDVPYLGGMFQRREDTRVRSEIIVALVPKILPLDGERHQLQQQELQRVQTPLLKGSLVENPRPWEASMPDPLRHSQRRHTRHQNRAQQNQLYYYNRSEPSRSGVRTASSPDLARRAGPYAGPSQQRSAVRQAGHVALPPPARRPNTTHRKHPTDYLRKMKLWR